MPLKEMQEDLLKRKAKIEEQLSNVAKALNDMEEDMGGYVLKAKGKKKWVETAPQTTTGAINESTCQISSEKGDQERGKAKTRESRRQRLKSGFRICKPDGTFIWPNDMAASFSAHLMIQVEDVLAVSSPSVCSSKSPLPPPPPPPPPQQPQSAVLRLVAKKPCLGVFVSTVTVPTTVF